MREDLSAIDASFLKLDTETTHQAIASFIPLDRPPCPERLRMLVERTVDRLPRFRSTVADGAHWLPVPNFSVDDHIEIVIRPEMRSFDDLTAAAGALFSRGLPMSKPLWSITVLSNTPLEPATTESKSSNAEEQTSGSRPLVALLYSFHHTLTDGMGALQAIDLLYSKKRDEDPRELRDESTSTRAADARPPSLRKNDQVSVMKSFFRLLRDGFSRHSRGALNGKNSAERELSVVDIPIATLRELRTRLGGSLNDLLLTAVSGAVRRYHDSTGGDPQDQRIVMPVSLRRPSGKLTLGNHLTAVGVPLPVSIGDPLERFAMVKRTIDRIKHDGSFGAYALLSHFTAKLPPWLGAKLSNAAAKRTSFICTNMPGPVNERFIAGARVEGNYGLAALMRSHGVAFAFISYAQKLCVSLVTDPQIVPEPKRLAEYFADSIEELGRLAPSLNDSSAQAPAAAA